MINLILAIISSALVSIFMRLSERRVKNEMFMFTANYVVCALLSAGFGGLSAINVPGSSTALWLGLISGIMYLAAFVLLKINVSKSGVVMSSMFMKLGVLVPTIMAVVAFGERPDVYTVAGFVIALIAIITVNGFKKGEGTGKGALLLIALLFFGGLADSFANIYDKLGTAEHKDLYLLITFATACAASVAVGIKKGQKPGLTESFWGALLGIPNYFCSRFLLGALSSLSAMVVYPVFNIAVILIISLCGVIAFKEKLNKRQIAGLALIPAALLLLNI